MSERNRWMLSLLTVAALAALVIIEAARSDHVGLVGLACLIELVTLGLVWSLRSRAPVPLRADLVAWLETTASMTGESPTELADHAVSSYRAAMHDEPEV